MKGRSIFRFVVITTMLMIFVGSVAAQHRPRRFQQRPQMRQSSSIGVRFGNDFKNDQYFIGGHFWVPVGIFWRFIPSADYYFNHADYKRWQFNGDLIFKPRPAGPLHFGGGVAVQYLTVDKKSDVGGNVIIGLDFSRLRMPIMSPYIQARWTFLDKNNQFFSLLGGINFILK